MESEDALTALAALGQPTRLEAFRLLVRHEPEGMAAGDLAQALGAPANTLSAHLNVLSHAGLVRGERRGRENGSWCLLRSFLLCVRRERAPQPWPNLGLLRLNERLAPGCRFHSSSPASP